MPRVKYNVYITHFKTPSANLLYFFLYRIRNILRNRTLYFSVECTEGVFNNEILTHAQERFLLHKTRGVDPVFSRIPEPGLCTPKDRRYSKYYKMNILDNFEAFFFVYILLVSDVLCKS